MEINIATKLIDLLSSPITEELGLIWNFKHDLENMKITVSAIKAVLGDAEGKGKAINLQLSAWLQKVNDLFMDADDLLDDLSAEALRRRVMTQNRRAKEVRVFFSKSNQIAYRLKMGHQLKEIMKRLDQIAKVKNDLKFIEPSSLDGPALSREREQTHSFVLEREVIGRENEKNRVISCILDSNVKENVSVVSIVGIGGLGKTALAQLVYGDEVIQNCFELKLWVCVSDEFGFDVKQIAQKVLEQITNNEAKSSGMEKVQQDLRNKIEGKRFLLVLDDVWNEDRELWLELKKLLMGGGTRSKIIVTTRSENVARIMDAHSPISLEGLDEKQSWELFCRLVFEKDEEPNAKLIEIGKDIVRKCVGVPLAIRTMGSLLYSRNLGERDWTYFRDNELSDIALEENKVFKILKLSYDHLPSYLKNCFAYCSLFPKDFEIERETLIQLGIAQGFIESSNQSRRVEDVGHEYFMKLLSRCLFQDVKKDEFGEIRTCKMHDLIHDLAKLVSENEYIVISESNNEILGDRIRHVSFEFKSFWWEVPTSVIKVDKLRTFLSPKRVTKMISSHHLPPSFPMCLRVLDLNCLQIREIPRTIGNLKHLRYLDLSYNNLIQKLPRSITKLHNLQTLKLFQCSQLQELPRDINKMVNLRHLVLDFCIKLTYMPQRLGHLTNLQTMTRFVINNRSDSARISVLGCFNSLRGKLVIRSLEAQQGNMGEVESAKLLIAKPHLRELELYWSYGEMDKDEREQIGCKDQMLLEALQPNHMIKTLHINGFSGKMLPEWIGDLTSLLKLEIYHCTCLMSLPESIGNLTSLQELKIKYCYVLPSLPYSIGNLTSLCELKLKKCSSLASLPESIGNLSSLQRLEITHCYGLASLPKSMGNFTSLQELKITNCSSLTSLPETIGNLTSLQDLDISGCSSFASLPESIKKLTSLQRVGIAHIL